MSRTRSAGSIFWGLILIAAGSIFLAKNLGYDVPIWTGAARYWPVLLIVWGLIKLVDYARWKSAGATGPLFSAGEVVLLILVILSGTALTAAANISPDFGYLFDMANIGTPYRIVSFIVLGILLVGTSYLYHRFRDRILGIPAEAAK